MKKIAVVTGYHIKNYGSALQAFATQRVLDNMNIQNECIKYVKKKDINQLLRIFNIPLLKTKLKETKKKIYAKKYPDTLGKNFKIRNKIFDDFVSKNFRVSKEYFGYESLKEGINDYDAVLLGSDQVWNPLNFGSHYYTLEFVPDSIPKITYAPSFGVSKIPRTQRKATINYLKLIEYISVREKKGQEIIKELTGRDVPVVLDPTLLLDIEEWKEIYNKEKIVKDKYILCYFLGTNQKHREFAKKSKEKTGYKIITLPFMDEIVKEDFEFADEKLYNVGPSEFLNLIDNAEFVCTDSFHGTVFSVLNHKKFFIFNRYDDSKKVSTNSRISSLLSLLGLEERLCNSIESAENIVNNEISYSEVDEKLKKLKQDSMSYLENSIKAAIKESD